MTNPTDPTIPDVTIVIPVFNKVELTRACLASLDRHTTRRLAWEVVVVDNASSDTTSTFLNEAKQKYPWLRTIANAENLGFAKATNQGIMSSRSRAVLLLNNDTEALPGWLEPMWRTLFADPRVGAVGSKLLFGDGKIQHAGVFLAESKTSGDPLIAMHMYWQTPGDHPPAQCRRAYQVLTGACLLLKRDVIDQVGLIDEGFWNGYEDVDWCLRIGEVGYLCIYEPESVLYHHESQSGPERFRKVDENIKLLQRKWLSKVKVDYLVSQDGIVARNHMRGIWNYLYADDVTFDDVLNRSPGGDLSQSKRELLSFKPRVTQPVEGCYNVVIVEQADYPHSEAFADIGDLLVESLRDLGCRAQLSRNRFRRDAKNIVLGYNLLSDTRILASYHHIIYQLEQLSDREGWSNPALLEVLRQADEVWDYSSLNIDYLRGKGISNVPRLPIGFHERMRRLPRVNQDKNVLFFGSMNERRRAILEEVGKVSPVTCLVNVYGEARNEYIARSKIILNLHYYESQILEEVRLSYLINNRAFVISEDSPENVFGQSLVCAPANRIAELVDYYLKHPKERYERNKQAYETFAERPMIEYLRPLVRAEASSMAVTA